MSEANTALDHDAVADEWTTALAEQQAAATAPAAEAAHAPQAQVGAQPAAGSPRTAAPAAVPGAADMPVGDLSMILDIPVQLTVELGRTKISIKHILQLAQGSVVELDALAGEPMDVLVNGYLIAQGEVVVVNEKFGVRLTDIVTPSERMRRLSRDA